MTALSESQILSAATLLADTRASRGSIPTLGELTPTDAATAEAISDAGVDLAGAEVAGWKVGCTSEFAQQMLGSPGPFAGRVFDGTVFDATIDSAAVPNAQVECEFAFILGESLPAREARYSSVEEVRAATRAVAPAIEVVAPRVSDLANAGWLSLVADHGANAGVVIGAPVPVADLPDLAEVDVSCLIDGETVGAGRGDAVLGNPWNALLWLAEHLRGRGIGLQAGQFVMSGTCTGIAPLAPGSAATAHHVGLGEVTLSSSASLSLE